jgi:peptidylprolyl isomerase
MKPTALAFALIAFLPIADLARAQPDILAQRGSVKLTVSDIKAALDAVEPATRAQMQANPAALAEFVRDRLLRQTLLAEARADDMEKNALLMARANEARDLLIVQGYIATKAPVEPSYPSEKEIAAAYESNKARFAVPKQYRVAQMAFLAPTGAPRDVDEGARKKAQDARLQALKPKADFAELARKMSQDETSAAKGGDLGWLREDQLQPAIRAVIAALPENAVSEIVRGNDAWHVVKLMGARPPSTLPLNKVSDGLVQALRQNKAQQNMRAYIAGLLQKEPIQLNEIELAHQLAGGR